MKSLHILYRQIIIFIQSIEIFVFLLCNLAPPVFLKNINDVIRERPASITPDINNPRTTNYESHLKSAEFTITNTSNNYQNRPTLFTTKVLLKQDYIFTTQRSIIEETEFFNITYNITKDLVETIGNKSCNLKISDEMARAKVKDQISRLSLVEFRLKLLNDSTNIFETGFSNVYKANRWSRATAYGHTLLSLAFNYGILSLMTLTINTNVTNIEIVDLPQGCFVTLDEDERLVLLKDMMTKEFEEKSEDKYQLQICYEEIIFRKGLLELNYAKFVNRCCQRDQIDGNERCGPAHQNMWLNIIYSLLHLSRVAFIFFGPLLFVQTISGLANKEFSYVVKLKNPLVKKICILRTNPQEPNYPKPKLSLDLRRKGELSRLKDSIQKYIQNEQTFKFGKILKCKFTKYNILVNHKRLLTENCVRVGFWNSIISTFFLCKLKNFYPFKGCCEQSFIEFEQSEKHKNLHEQGTSIENKWLSLYTKDSAKEHVKYEEDLGKQNSGINAKWITLCSKIGIFLIFAVLIPLPYYFRLFIFYVFEYDEIISRKNAIRRLNLYESFENSFCHYFLPTHPFFIFIYCIYAMIAFLVILTEKNAVENIFGRTVIGAFTDLKNLPWSSVIGMATSNLIWPFDRFGIFGFFFCILYWPIAIPLTTVVSCVYFLPTVYLTFHMFFCAVDITAKKNISNRINKKPDTNLKMFTMKHYSGSKKKDNNETNDKNSEIENQLKENDKRIKNISAFLITSDRIESGKNILCATNNENAWKEYPSKECDKSIKNLNAFMITSVRIEAGKPILCEKEDEMASYLLNKEPDEKNDEKSQKKKVYQLKLEYLKQFFVSLFCVAGLYSVLIIISECLGCFLDILVFTMMGIIVNANTTLKYAALVIIIFVYSFDSFNNVEKKYLKLNKALFSELKSRISNLDEVTRLSSNKQENQAFKTEEQSQYDDKPDDIVRNCNWRINDLVLFIDNNDMPRIPSKLFYEVCNINVPGVPGPVYIGLLDGLKKFAKILILILFIFMIILSFGNAYSMSETSQMLATVAGGFLPFILRTFMEPEKPEIDSGSMSFKNRMEEVIRSFSQEWPIYDFDFEPLTEEEKLIESQKDKKIEESIIKNSTESNSNSNEKAGKKILLFVIESDSKINRSLGSETAGSETAGSETFVESNSNNNTVSKKVSNEEEEEFERSLRDKSKNDFMFYPLILPTFFEDDVESE